MINNAIETAIKMETDAIAFYKEASEKTQHPFAGEMFRGFIKDETRHLKMLKDIFSGIDVEFRMISPKETIRTVFSELKDRMMQRAKALESEIEAVKIALKFEYEGFEFYKKAAASATTDTERKLFDRLASEEQEHYTILNNTHAFLDHTGQWFMYEEGGIVEG